MLFTVFTPTHNRAHTLSRVFDSLQAQTLRDFEWLIVDDGSTDGTRALVESWTADFPIRYIFQEHGGKHRAFNRGVAAAHGELFLNLDSDDACVPRALEVFANAWAPIARDEGFSAVTALCVDEAGAVVGSRFPTDVCDSDSLEIRYRHKVTGEKWGFHRTRVLREFPFPDFDGVFVPEGVVWAKIARRYKTRFINEPLRIYYQDRGQEKLTRPAKMSRVARARALWHEERLNHDLDYFTAAPVEFLRNAVQLTRLSLHARKAPRVHGPGVLLALLGLPFGAALFGVDKIRGL